MLRILLVEDEAPKRQHIEGFLNQLAIPTSVRVARSVTSALDALDAEAPDLLLLDMSLPTFDIGERETGGRPQGFGGIEILRHMKMSDLTIPTIILTGYEAFPRQGERPVGLAQLRSELEREFSEFLYDTLHYNSTFDEWKNALRRALSDLGEEGIIP